MSRKIEINTKTFKGSVTIADPITIPMALLIDEAMGPPPEKKEQDGNTKKVWLTPIDVRILPAVLACVEKWEVSGIPENVTEDTYPASPRADSHSVLMDIFNELMRVYFGDLNVPNA
jgi:hypothetical protein